MKKIPTLFVRNPDDRKHVLNEVTPGCEWVLAGEGVATRKYDGTCMMHRDGEWFARREVKPGKQEPPNFEAVDHDETTGKSVGWEPASQSGWEKYLREAGAFDLGWDDGTYELVGPKVNGNPERMTGHILVPHGKAPLEGLPRDFEALRQEFTEGEWPAHWEGIVWHHPDGRMVKLKRRDFA
jgi:hypothetical protein